MGNSTGYVRNSNGSADQKITAQEIEHFCEGNIGLKKALIHFNEQGIKTVACCGGHFDSIYDKPYLAFSIEETMAQGTNIGRNTKKELFETLALTGMRYPKSSIVILGREDDRMIQLVANSNGHHEDMFETMVQAHEDLIAGRETVPMDKLNEIRCLIKGIYALRQAGTDGQIVIDNEHDTISPSIYDGDFEVIGKGNAELSSSEYCEFIDKLDTQDIEACARLGIPSEKFERESMTGLEETVEGKKVGLSTLKRIIAGFKDIIMNKNKTNNRTSNEMNYEDRSE